MGVARHMKYLRFKDIRNRQIVKKNEIRSKIAKILFINLRFSQHFVPKQISKKLFSHKSRVKSRCLISNNGRSINKRFNISRCKLRELIGMGVITGYKKAVW